MATSHAYIKLFDGENQWALSNTHYFTNHIRIKNKLISHKMI